MDYSAIFALSPNPYVLLDAAFTIVDMNAAYLRVTGRTRSDIIGRSMFEAFPSPTDAAGAMLRASLQRAFDQGQPDHLPLIHYPIPLPDGTFENRYWSATHTPFKSADGAVHLVLQHTVDVTELHRLRLAADAFDGTSGPSPMVARDIVTRAEAVQAVNTALSGRLDHLTSLFDQAPGFMAVLSGPDHVFELANEAYLAIVGRRPLIGRPVRDALPELKGQGFYELLDEVYRTGRPYIGRRVRALIGRGEGQGDGERYLDFIYQPVIETGGRVTGIFVQGQDVTDQAEAERLLEEERHSLDILYRSGQALAATLDLDAIVQGITDAGVELTGAKFGAFFYNVETAAGEGYMLYALSGVPRTAFESFPMPRNTAVFTPTFTGESTVLSDDILADPRYGRNAPHRGMPAGHLPVRSYLAVPVKRQDGGVIGGLFFGHPEPGLFNERLARNAEALAAQAAIAFENARLFGALQTEVRERRRAEADLQALNANLEREVAERTEELRQREIALQQSQRLESIGKLTGGIAHDFNNLLQVIAGNLHLLAKDVSGSERAERRVQSALAGVFRGAKLASQLLAFGRRQPLEPKVINVGRFVRGLDDMIRRAIGEEIEVETIVAGGLWNTMADPTQVENALLNLAINARDAMEGRGRLTIEVGNAWLDDAYAALHPDVSAGQYVMLAVTDTGSGIPSEILERVFEPFFTTKAEGRGTGLGLSMVYGFVKQSGGHIKIYSEVGHGTTIRLYLPRSHEPEDLVAEVDTSAAAGGTEVVLVVEDDDEVRATVVEMLSDLGYRVLKAADASAALAIIESGIAVDLLFTDVVMPGPLRSPELARKARERLPGIAVLFTSGYTENAIVHGGRLDPGVDLLSKPYTRTSLARKIRHVLRNAEQRREIRALPAAKPPNTGETRPGLAILLVEDDGLIRMNTADQLADLGHDVVEAASAAEAFDRLAERRFDVVMTDLSLPDGSGADVARAARLKDRDVAVVFASGRDTVDGLDPAVSGGRGFSLLVKPYGMRDLARALESLNGPQGPTSNGRQP